MEKHMAVVMVVESVPSLNRLYTKMLVASRFNVLQSSTHTGAMKQLAIAAPDILVLNMDMPSRGGIVVANYVKQFFDQDEIKMVLLTSDNRERWIRYTALENIIQTPAAPSQMLETVFQLTTRMSRYASVSTKNSPD